RSAARRSEYGAGKSRYVLITDSPSPSEHRLGVDLVSHAQPGPDSVGISRLVEVAVARAGVPNRPEASAGIRIGQRPVDLPQPPVFLPLGSGVIPAHAIIHRQLAGDLPGVLHEESPLLITIPYTHKIGSLINGSKITQQETGVAEALRIPVEVDRGLEWLGSGTHAGREGYAGEVRVVADHALNFI